MQLYRIETKSGHSPEQNWIIKFKQDNYCHECKMVHLEARTNNIDIWLREKPGISALNSVRPPGVGFARRVFLDLFWKEINQYFHVGKVYNHDGSLLNQYASFTSTKHLFVRGSQKHSRYFGVCSLCNRLSYVPFYPFYVLRKDYFEQPIYEQYNSRGLILNEELMSRVQKGKWKGISIFKVPIVDDPQDGFDLPPVNKYSQEVEVL